MKRFLALRRDACNSISASATRKGYTLMFDEQGDSPERTHQEAKVILIVEDDNDLGTFLEEVLHAETPFYAVRVADGFAALKLIQGLKPNLIILDYLLPLMNGLEIYDHIRAIQGFETIPTLFMTASAGMPRRQLEKRKATYLCKPFDLNTFLQTVEKLLTDCSVDLSS